MRKLRFKLKIVTFLALAIAVLFLKDYAEREWFYPIKYQEIVEKYCNEFSVDEALALAVINCESGFDPNAVSSAGACGLMQLTPETFQWLQTKDDSNEDFGEENLFNPDINIKYGVFLLSLNLQEFGNTDTAIAAYNAGRGKVSEWLNDENNSTDSQTLTHIPYTETEKYVEKVNRSYKVYKKRIENQDNQIS